MQVTVVVSFLVLLLVGAWGVAQVRDGLDLTDIVPRDTPEFSFLDAQAQYFGFFSIYAVTKVSTFLLRSCCSMLRMQTKKNKTNTQTHTHTHTHTNWN